MARDNGSRKPDIILVGTGVGGLQITVEGQRVLDKVGRAYALHLTPALRAHLKKLRVRTIDLGDVFATDSPPDESYSEATSRILDRVRVEYPVVVLTPGSPMFLNSISRALTIHARRSDLTVQTIPAVSPLDALISYIGLDVSGYGLQVFTARRLASRPRRLDPTVPLIVLEMAGVDGVDNTAYTTLVRSLAASYPADHPTTLVNLNGGGARHAGLPLRRFAELLRVIRPDSHLFIDVVRNQSRQATRKENN